VDCHAAIVDPGAPGTQAVAPFLSQPTRTVAFIEREETR